MFYHQSEFDITVSTAHSGFFFQPSGGASFMLSGTGYSNNISSKSISSYTYLTKNLFSSSLFFLFLQLYPCYNITYPQLYIYNK